MTEQADASGLLYRRNRYYDPLSGQFTQPDPIGIAGGLNLYGYAGGDPVNGSDPFGLKVCFRRAGRARLVQEMERGTGSSISLDSEGCIESVTGTDTTGRFDELRNRLLDLHGATETYTVGLTAGGSYYNPSNRWAGISVQEPFVRSGT